MKILALDIGKFNTMCCFYDSKTRKHSFLNATTDRNYLKTLFKTHICDLVAMEASSFQLVLHTHSRTDWMSARRTDCRGSLVALNTSNSYKISELNTVRGSTASLYLSSSLPSAHVNITVLQPGTSSQSTLIAKLQHAYSGGCIDTFSRKCRNGGSTFERIDGDASIVATSASSYKPALSNVSAVFTICSVVSPLSVSRAASSRNFSLNFGKTGCHSSRP